MTERLSPTDHKNGKPAIARVDDLSKELRDNAKELERADRAMKGGR